MAVLGQKTVNNVLLIEVDADPSVSGVTAPLGSQAYWNSGLTGLRFLKTGTADTAWTPMGSSEFAITSFSGLTINYTGGRFLNGVNGNIINVPSGSIVVSANVTLGYLYVAVNTLNSGSPTVTAATTLPPADSLQFAQFVSNESAVTSVTDIRAGLHPVPLVNLLRLSYPGTGLTVNYNSGAVRINGVFTTIAAGSIVLTANTASGAIYVDPTTALVTANTTGTFPANCTPLATYTTNASAVTALSGQRNFLGNNVVFATPVSTSTANTQGTANSFARSDHAHNTVLVSSEATGTADATTTSVTNVLLTGMTTTPQAGTYFITFSCSGENTNNGRSCFYSIFVGGSQQTATERFITTNGGVGGSCSTSCVATVDGSQAIEIRWRVDANTGTTHQRRLTALRIG